MAECNFETFFLKTVLICVMCVKSPLSLSGLLAMKPTSAWPLYGRQSHRDTSGQLAMPQAMGLARRGFTSGTSSPS